MSRGFYVSMIRGRRTALLAGPFATHDEALALVQPARQIANEIDPWSDFDLFGTCSTEALRPGVLNIRLGLDAK